MDEIRSIYKKVIEETPYMEKVNAVVDLEIEKLLKPEKEEMKEEQYEQYRGKIYQILAAAEEESFIAGFRYATALFLDAAENRRIIAGL